MDIGKPTPAPAGANDLVKDANMKTFMADVVQASMKVPVLVDFWAPWCGPCKTLGPIIEKAVRAAGGKVKLVKVNIDEPMNQPLAQQLRIQSIPAVYAFHGGQPVDGFVGALPESQVKEFISRIMGDSLAPDPIDELITHGKAALEQKDADTALKAFQAAAEEAGGEAPVIAGLARAWLLKGDLAMAKEELAKADASLANDAEIVAASGALQLAEQSASAAGSIGALEAAARANPKDLQARFDLAVALAGSDRREDGVTELLEIIRIDRKWNDEAARKQLVKLFEIFGPMDPLTIDARKRLSSILFA